ncbi:MAG: iron-sulfur cluster assembly protein [Desulfovibrionaceae bacterium]|nr:iron-sulfur cluster assembly protein [Desulfovibrionaceae bacterium]
MSRKNANPLQNKAIIFMACLGILALIAVSLYKSTPEIPAVQVWKNSGYNPQIAEAISEGSIRDLLNRVRDPEVDLTVPELGLIYKTTIEGSKVHLLMTLTTPSCPWSSQLLEDIRKSIFLSKDVSELKITITFDPPWTINRIDPAAMNRLKGGTIPGAGGGSAL